MKILEKAWALQQRFEQHHFDVSWLTDEYACFLAGLFCMFTGVALFFYVIFTGTSLLFLRLTSNPLFYLILGICFIMISLFLKFVDKKEADK